jgi:hypothetical protein
MPKSMATKEESNFENEDESELDGVQEGAIACANEIFENIWGEMKQEVEGASKREACKYSFVLGFLNYMKMMDKESTKLEKEMKKMSKQDFEKLLNGFKNYNTEKND